MKNPDTNSVIRVAIADDHALFRTGVKTSLSRGFFFYPLRGLNLPKCIIKTELEIGLSKGTELPVSYKIEIKYFYIKRLGDFNTRAAGQTHYIMINGTIKKFLQCIRRIE